MGENINYPEGLYVRRIPPFRNGFTESNANGETFSIDKYEDGSYVATDLYSSTHGYGDTWDGAVSDLLENMGLTGSGTASGDD